MQGRLTDRLCRSVGDGEILRKEGFWLRDRCNGADGTVQWCDVVSDLASKVNLPSGIFRVKMSDGMLDLPTTFFFLCLLSGNGVLAVWNDLLSEVVEGKIL